VGVEKLILVELAKKSSFQNALQAIFSDRVDTGFEAVYTEYEFFNSYGC
jgi:hypothetical protein